MNSFQVIESLLEDFLNAPPQRAQLLSIDVGQSHTKPGVVLSVVAGHCTPKLTTATVRECVESYHILMVLENAHHVTELRFLSEEDLTQCHTMI